MTLFEDIEKDITDSIDNIAINVEPDAIMAVVMAASNYRYEQHYIQVAIICNMMQMLTIYQGGCGFRKDYMDSILWQVKKASNTEIIKRCATIITEKNKICAYSWAVECAIANGHYIEKISDEKKKLIEHLAVELGLDYQLSKDIIKLTLLKYI